MNYSGEVVFNASQPEGAPVKISDTELIDKLGWNPKINFDKHNKILKQKLLEDNISIKGFPIRATYNSPFTLPPLRRNESMFSVDWKE